MNKYSHPPCQVLHDVQWMSVEDLEDKYDIEIDDIDGTVWDNCEHRSFNDLSDWGTFMEELEAPDFEEVERFRPSKPNKRGFRDD